MLRASRAATLLLFLGCATVEDPARTISSSTYLLRAGKEAEWEEFAGRTPDGKDLELKFEAHTNATEQTLFIKQDNVKGDWPVLLNETKLGTLHVQEHPLTMTYALAPGFLKEGENKITIKAPGGNDDILVGPIRLDARPLQEALGQATLQVTVIDPSINAALPSRLTVVDRDGALAPILAAPGQRVAVRPGVIYTADGQVNFSLPAGKYTVVATRGFEYGIDRRTVTLKPGGGAQFVLKIRREVSTPNLAACDTHIHTRELSGHGDSTLDECMMTIAGEGIELPVCTEHNQHGSHEAAAVRTGLRDRFTPINGNEVTTPSGHFNIFPVTGGTAASWKGMMDWTEILKGIRATPGVRVAILNHPRSLHDKFIPFDAAHFNPVTGDNLRGPDFTFDAIELVNSGALRSDPMQVYRDWFALLNHGYRIPGVGSSDTHTVNYTIVGQGRTYVVCDDSDPSRIDVNQVCESLLKGKLLVSMGLLTQIKVNDRYGVGDLVTEIQDELRVEVTVSGPTWCQVDCVELYQNGVKVKEERVPLATGAGEKVKLDWRLPKPPQDSWLVAIATGPGIRELYWPTKRPYQPSSPIFTPRLIGSTSPVWLDADGDGTYTAPRELARRLVAKHGSEAADLIPALAPYDEAVAAQTASLCVAAGKDIRSPGFTAKLQQAREPVRRGFAAYIATLK